MVVELAVAGFTIGAISFVISIRKAVSTIIEDIDAVRNDYNFLIDADFRLKLVAQELWGWRKLWHINEASPENLFAEYWGSDGEQQILTYAEHIENIARAALVEFRSLYPGIQDAFGSHGVDNNLEDEIHRSLQSLQQRCKQKLSGLTKTARALFLSPKFERHLNTLENSIQNLQRHSKILFINHRRDGQEGRWERHVSETSFGLHLVELAQYNFDTSTLIRQLLLNNTENHMMELCLDHKADPTYRVEVIETAFRAKAISHHFRLFHKGPKELTHTDFSCTVLGKHVEVRRPYSANCSDFATVVGRFQRAKDEASMILYLDKGQQSFIVQKDGVMRDMADTEFECLRTFMLNQKSEPLENLHGNFTKEERHRLAYELAEWTLLLLRTRWFADICSCRITRTQTRSLQTTFGTTIIPVYHIDPETGNHDLNTQWCQQELTGMHIRRLGVILVEIACIKPIFELDLHPRRGIRFFLPPEDYHTIDDEVPLRMIDLYREVLQSMGRDYLDAVHYCLEQDKTTSDITSTDVQDFYTYVIDPLYRHYHELTVEKAEARMLRRAKLQKRPQRMLQLNSINIISLHSPYPPQMMNTEMSVCLETSRTAGRG